MWKQAAQIQIFPRLQQEGLRIKFIGLGSEWNRDRSNLVMHILKLVCLAGLLLFSSGQQPLEPCGYNRKGKTSIRITEQEPTDRLKKLIIVPKPHDLRIQARYLQGAHSKAGFSAVRDTFSVARYFYSKVLKVTYLPQHKTKYPNYITLRTSCDIHIEESYRREGIDQNTADMLVMINTINSTKDEFVASAQCCAFSRRPLYGYIEYNYAYMNVNLLSRLHIGIQVTIHELAHVLGFAEEFYSAYYTTPMGNTLRNINDVLRKLPNNKYMIITPKVKQYVQKYFKCTDGVTGALLENEGIAGTANNHWESNVYRDQLMTPMYLQSGNKITLLTLALLQDTNFYQEVDSSLAQPVLWGAGQGCNFALQKDELLPPLCDPAYACDFYSQFMSKCEVNTYTSKTPIDTVKDGGLCQIYYSSLDVVSDNSYDYPSDTSRCFMLANRQAACYQTLCTGFDGPISVVVNGVTGICRFPNQQITVSGVRLFCPRNFKVFCVHKGCKNWCSGHGICLNGVCLCSPGWVGTDCSLRG